VVGSVVSGYFHVFLWLLVSFLWDFKNKSSALVSLTFLNGSSIRSLGLSHPTYLTM
jgi:hypothetical protein